MKLEGLFSSKYFCRSVVLCFNRSEISSAVRSHILRNLIFVASISKSFSIALFNVLLSFTEGNTIPGFSSRVSHFSHLPTKGSEILLTGLRGAEI